MQRSLQSCYFIDGFRVAWQSYSTLNSAQRKPEFVPYVPALTQNRTQALETMRLINTTTLQLETFPDEREIDFAILSHRWEEEEILFEHMSPKRDSHAEISRMRGFRKVLMCCDEAKKDGLDYVWVDTCCIDKSSSAELQEAINSMYRWYSKANVCYAYLSDVICPDPKNSQIRASQWFKRGWTLQELLAPTHLEFFDQAWTSIGTRRELSGEIESITSIPATILVKGFDMDDMEEKPSIAEIMSWARGRQTTRLEDRSYSLMGLFDVNMPMLYGEGDKAFKRLQEEIIRNTHDQSIFAWEGIEDGNPGLLAQSPENFPHTKKGMSSFITRTGTHTITNEGISITVDLRPWVPQIYLAVLNCTYVHDDPKNSYIKGGQRVGIFLRKVDGEGRYARTKCRSRDLWCSSQGFENYYSASDFEDSRNQRISVVTKLVSRWEKTVVRGPIPFSGFHIAVLGNGKDLPSNVDVFQSPLARYDDSMGQVGLPDGASGVVGEVVVWPSSRIKIRIKLALYKEFVPYCIVYYGLPFESRARWYIGNSGWAAASSYWKDHFDGLPESHSLTISRGPRKGLSSDKGEYFCPKSNMVVLHPSPDGSTYVNPCLAIVDAVVAFTEGKKGEQQIRIQLFPPEEYEGAPWRVCIYPSWADTSGEEMLNNVHAHLNFHRQ